MRPDLVITIVAIALSPLALRRVNFPFRLNWIYLTILYGLIALEGVIFAAILWGTQQPELLREMAKRYWSVKPKLLMFVMFVALLTWFFGVVVALWTGIFTLVITEFIQCHSEQAAWLTQLVQLLPAGGYLFAGLLIAWVYTNVIVRVRFYGAYDPFFNRADLWIFHTTVPTLAHHAARILPSWGFTVLNTIYSGMFAQIGATVVICGLTTGWRRGIQFVGTILLAYYLSVGIFYLWPSHGPYYLCVDHAQHVAALINHVSSYATQREFLAQAKYIWEGNSVQQIPVGYYIAFPCMHIAQPLVVLWFLRRWKRIVSVLAIYDVFLVAAIILLEWHYLVDLLGGIVVAAAAVFFAEYASLRTANQQRAFAQSGAD
jgi:hypothetical protein